MKISRHENFAVLFFKKFHFAAFYFNFAVPKKLKGKDFSEIYRNSLFMILFSVKYTENIVQGSQHGRTLNTWFHFSFFMSKRQDFLRILVI